MVFVRFFGRTENFLQDWLDFLWDYWKLKFSQKKSRQICLLFRNNCLWKNNGGCPFLGGKESFLPDFLKFLWDYSKWNIHRKKASFLSVAELFEYIEGNARNVCKILHNILVSYFKTHITILVFVQLGVDLSWAHE